MDFGRLHEAPRTLEFVPSASHTIPFFLCKIYDEYFEMKPFQDAEVSQLLPFSTKKCFFSSLLVSVVVVF